MALVANQYTADISGTTSTGQLLNTVLTFNANYIRITNTGTVPLRATFTSSVASTSDYSLPSGNDREFYTPSTMKLGIMTTSTSTDGTDWRQARVIALGE